MALQNGQVWQNEKGQRVLTQWLLGQDWALLATPSERKGGPGTEMLPVLRYGLGCIWYHPEPLENWLRDHGWTPSEITVVENL